MTLVAIVISHLAIQFLQSLLHILNEIHTTRGHAAERQYGLALGMVVGDREDFAVIAKAMRNAFDDLIGALTRFRIQDFHLQGRGWADRARRGRTSSIENNRNRSAACILIESEHSNQLVAGCCRMTRLAGRQFRPAMQQAVTIDKNACQCHQIESSRNSLVA